MDPGIGAHRDLGPERSGQHRDCINRIGEQVVRDELVVAFHALIGQIEENNAGLMTADRADEPDRFQVLLIERLKLRLHDRVRGDVGEFAFLHLPDDVGHGVRRLGAFDDEHQLRGRSLDLNGIMRASIAGTVDDVRPFNQFVQLGHAKAILFPGDVGDEHRARAVARIEVMLRRIGALVEFGVFGRQEGALMMIEPPGEPGLGGEFEVDNRVDAAIEQSRVPGLIGRVHHAGVHEVGAGMKLFTQETAEESGRGRPVEAMVVMENANPHELRRGKPIRLPNSKGQSQLAGGRRAAAICAMSSN